MVTLPRIQPIPRVPNDVSPLPSLADPCIIRDTSPVSCSSLSLTHLRAHHGHVAVPVEVGPHYMHPDHSSGHMIPLVVLIDYILSTRATGMPIAYCAQCRLFDVIPAARRWVSLPHVATRMLRVAGMQETNVNVWIGPAATVTPLHYDVFPNVVCQLEGVKRCVLVEEYDTSRMGVSHDPARRTTSVMCDDPTVAHNWAAVPSFGPQRMWEGDLHPGEALYIPPRLWHYVEARSASVTVNFWGTRVAPKMQSRPTPRLSDSCE